MCARCRHHTVEFLPSPLRRLNDLRQILVYWDHTGILTIPTLRVTLNPEPCRPRITRRVQPQPLGAADANHQVPRNAMETCNPLPQNPKPFWGSDCDALSPESLQPSSRRQPLNPKPLNPKPLTPKPLNPKPPTPLTPKPPKP